MPPASEQSATALTAPQPRTGTLFIHAERMNASPDPSSHRSRACWLGIALIYSAATSLAHLEFSLWLVARRSSPFGTYALKDAIPIVGIAAAVALAVWLLHQFRQTRSPWTRLAPWLLWAACVAGVDHFLTYSVPEYAHYPQYALLAWLLAHALDPGRERLVPGRILFWTTLLGIIDETLQYLWITATYSEYLDFNDFLVNLLGATAGVLLYYGTRGSHASRPLLPARPPRAELATASLLALCISLALHSERLVITPPTPVPTGGLMRDTTPQATQRLYLQRTNPPRYASWNAGPHRGRYWILDPLSGLMLLAGTGAAFAALIRRNLSPSSFSRPWAVSVLRTRP